MDIYHWLRADNDRTAICRINPETLTIQHKAGDKVVYADLRGVLTRLGWHVARLDEPSVWVIAE